MIQSEKSVIIQLKYFLQRTSYSVCCRVYNWSVTDQPGRVVADHWIEDDGVEKCHYCAIRYAFSECKHHCRNCGEVFCLKLV